MNEVDEILGEFLSESRDMVDDSMPKLIELGQSAESTGEVDEDVLNSIFRTFHSIKGTAAFLEFMHINEVTHTAENLLVKYRKHELKVDGDGIAVLLRTCDFMQNALDVIEATGNDSALEVTARELKNDIQVILDRGVSSPPEVAYSGGTDTGNGSTVGEQVTAIEAESVVISLDDDSLKNDAPQNTPSDLSDHTRIQVSAEMRERFVEEADDILEVAEGLLLSLSKEPGKSEELMPELFRQFHSFKGNCGFMGLSDLERLTHVMETEIDRATSGDDERRINLSKQFLDLIDTIRTAVADVSNGGAGRIKEVEQLCTSIGQRGNKTVVPLSVSSAPKKETSVSDGGKKNSPAKVMRRDIRVDLDKLDRLVNLVGELVIAQAMVTNNPEVRRLDLESFDRSASHLDRIVRDLQDVAMSVRMIPISGSFRKMIRLVHDLSRKFDKKVSLDLYGEETEIDKTVAEAIGDPLVHIIRNALDHGLETTAERIASGKPETGTVRLEARHEGGEIWILIQDDGHGLDRDRIVKKGIEKGLIDGDGSQMTDQEVYRLLFAPGFSTAAQVTDVSGRGVGMDVVKRNIEKLKGQIDVQSVLGKGTAFILKIPLTLAVIEGMLVRVGGAKYTIPMLSIRGCIQATNDDLVSPLQSHEVVKIREELFPVVRLSCLHDVQPDSEDLSQGSIVLVEDRSMTIAVLVDEILGQHQTVIKGLSDYVGNVKSVSGCTILGDGDVSLILDPAGIVSMASAQMEIGIFTLKQHIDQCLTDKSSVSEHM